MRKFFAMTVVGVAAAAIMLAVPATSSAHGYHHGSHHRYHHRYYGACGLSYRVCNVPLVQDTCNVAPCMPANTVAIRVVVPPDARVWFSDQETMQTGPVRYFESPPLAPGSDYSYDVTAQWRDPTGADVVQTRHVDVRANTQVRLNFISGALTVSAQ
jgi:uncharacterized protein (TIGR03000 family)